MAFAFAMPFVSCDKDDDVLDNTEQKHDPESDEDQTAIVPCKQTHLYKRSLIAFAI